MRRRDWGVPSPKRLRQSSHNESGFFPIFESNIMGISGMVSVLRVWRCEMGVVVVGRQTQSVSPRDISVTGFGRLEIWNVCLYAFMYM